MLSKVDKLILGGGMVFTFLKVQKRLRFRVIFAHYNITLLHDIVFTFLKATYYPHHYHPCHFSNLP